MPAGNRLTYGTLTLHSSEIVSFTYDREFKIINQGTVALLEITQPGNLSPIEFNLDCIIRDNASAKLTTWTNKLAEKPLEALTFISRSWGNYYLTNINIDCDEFDNFGDVLRMSMKLRFLSNQNFV